MKCIPALLIAATIALVSCDHVVSKIKWNIDESIPQNELVFELCKALNKLPKLKIYEVKEGMVEYQEDGETIKKELLAITGRIDFDHDDQSESLEFQISHHLEDGVWSYRNLSFNGDEIAEKAISQDTLLSLHKSLVAQYHDIASNLKGFGKTNQTGRATP